MVDEGTLTVYLPVVNSGYSAKCEPCVETLGGRLCTRTDPRSHHWSRRSTFVLTYNEETVNKVVYEDAVLVLVRTPRYRDACPRVNTIVFRLDSSKGQAIDEDREGTKSFTSQV